MIKEGLMGIIDADFKELKEIGVEGEEDMHYRGYLDGYMAGITMPDSLWIPAKDSLPKEDQLIAYSYKIGERPRMYGTIYYPEPSITDLMDYWMPIPELNEQK